MKHLLLVNTRSARRTIVLLLILALAVPVARQAAAYTPRSPKVQEMVQRAVRFLEENYQSQGQTYYPQLGGTCVTGLAVYMHTGSRNHPLVQAAIAKCEEACRKLQQGIQPPTAEKYNYSLGIAIVFLGELEDERYNPQISLLLNFLLGRQQDGGGWNYTRAHQMGDTSQTQYAVLAMWMADRAKVHVPRENIERVCGWLIRTQDPSGAWGYEGRDSGQFGQRVRQSQMRLSIAAAGLGSAYICADLLGFGRSEARPTRSRLPAFLREVGGEAVRRRAATRAITSTTLEDSLRDGNQWFTDNYRIQAPIYQHFYMYALEKCESFREYHEQIQDPEPSWYNEGVEYLADSQNADGHWQSSQAGSVIDSSFAILFLLRSTKRSLRDTVEVAGRLRGGKLLPSDITQIAIDPGGQVVSTKATPPIENLLELLEDLNASDFDTSIPQQLTLSDDPTQRAAQLAHLRRLATSGGYQARLTAVRTLGRDRNFDNVPALIAALNDPDRRIVRAARDGLRFISRKIDGFNLSDSPTEAEQKKAVADWKAWYRSVQPLGVR